MASDPRGAQQRDPVRGKPGMFGSSAGAQFMGLGLQFVLSLLLFLYLGQWVDRKLGTAPWFLILGVFIGASAAFYSMYHALKAEERREEEQDRVDRGEQ